MGTVRPEPLQPVLARVWRYFLDLAERRTVDRTVEPEHGPGGRGIAWRTHARPRKLSFVEINAWASVHRISLEAWEIVAITELDDFFLDDDAAKPVAGPRAPVELATAPRMRGMLDSLFVKKKPRDEQAIKPRRRRKGRR